MWWELRRANVHKMYYFWIWINDLAWAEFTMQVEDIVLSDFEEIKVLFTRKFTSSSEFSIP